MSITIETTKWGTKLIPRGRGYTTWELGLEYIQQEGSSAWQQIREKHGLSIDDLESLSAGDGNGSSYSAGGYVFREDVMMAEDRPGLPKFEHLCLLALLEDTSPGALLDSVILAKGQEIASEE